MPDPRVPFFGPRIRVIDDSATPIARMPAELDGGPPPIPGDRPKGCKRLHSKATVAAVRALFEGTALSFKQIAARCGTSHGTVRLWARHGNWRRYPFAPRPSDNMPAARAGRRLQLRVLEDRLAGLAERCVRETWNAPGVDIDRLVQAMAVLKAARRDARAHRRLPRAPDPPPRSGADDIRRDAAIRAALADMRQGPPIDAVPDAAMALLEEAPVPAREPPLRRGPRRRV
jgi:hypothetical protein